MDEAGITKYIVETFDGVETERAMGYVFFYFGAERKMPFATIATEDNEYDNASQLIRPDVFRLNIGVSPKTYRDMFGPQPAPPADKGVVVTGDDFAAPDKLMPHPVYAPQSWVCVLNPSEATFEKVKGMLDEAYKIAVRRQSGPSA